jgi:ABC-type polysaccharide/polyol phosphate transport system ATPase subunit
VGANAVEVLGLSKRYRVGGARLDLRDTLAAGYRGLRRRLPRDDMELWALRDVTFTVESGQSLGIIGRNGAGKSTLLKILGRIAEPTSGLSRTRGRVGTVLEAGTGFHPELTGRENIGLSGAILGLARRDIDRRMSEIVDFAGVGRFLDTPVKRYSSGMFLRLAFAVAAHLDSEILVLDEVLAVGDAEFQRRCLAHLAELGGEDRTILFVSHDLHAVAGLCSRAIWLDQGRIAQDGPADRVTEAYLVGPVPVRSAPVVVRAGQRCGPRPLQGADQRRWPDPRRTASPQARVRLHRGAHGRAVPRLHQHLRYPRPAGDQGVPPAAHPTPRRSVPWHHGAAIAAASRRSSGRDVARQRVRALCGVRRRVLRHHRPAYQPPSCTTSGQAHRALGPARARWLISAGCSPWLAYWVVAREAVENPT